MNEFINFLTNAGYEKVRIIVLGNSVASGFSLSTKMVPFMFHNKKLLDILEKNEISTEVYHFARPQDNSNKRILEWLYLNVSLKEISHEAGIDNQQMYTQTRHAKYTNANDDFQKYYRFSYEENRIRDLLANTDTTIYTFCVLSGCTGAFLDTLTRNKIAPFRARKMMGSFYRDLNYMEQILDYIEIINPFIPVFINLIHEVSLLLPLIKFGNFQIKKRTKRHNNAYVSQTTFCKGVYKTPEYQKPFFDYHPSPKEYSTLCELLNKSIESNVAIHLAKQAFYTNYRLFVQVQSKISENSDYLDLDKTRNIYHETLSQLTKLGLSYDVINIGYLKFLEAYHRDYPYNFYKLPIK